MWTYVWADMVLAWIVGNATLAVSFVRARRNFQGTVRPLIKTKEFWLVLVVLLLLAWRFAHLARVVLLVLLSQIN